MNVNAYFLCQRICPHYNCLQAVFLNGTSMVIKINDLAQSSPHFREEVLHSIGAPCGFSGRFQDGSFSMKTEMKICSNLH